MKYEAILYDMDGTVLDTLGDLCDSINYALACFELPALSMKQTAQYLGNGAKRLVALASGEEEGSELAEKILAVYKPYYDAHCRIKTAPYEGIVPLMEHIKKRNVKQAVISNKPDSAVQPLVKEFFDGLLEHAVGESKSVRRKPAPDMVLAAADKLGVSVEKCVYIGDSEVDLLTAKNAGMDCIAVSWGFRSVEQLKAAGAEIIVNSTQELEKILLRDNKK